MDGERDHYGAIPRARLGPISATEEQHKEGTQEGMNDHSAQLLALLDRFSRQHKAAGAVLSFQALELRAELVKDEGPL